MQALQGLITIGFLLVIVIGSAVAAYGEKGPWNGFGFILLALVGVAATTLVHLFG